MTEEASTESPPIEQTTPEIVTHPEFLSWKTPPYCELCNVRFTGESCSKLHFEGKSHKNRLHTWRKYQAPEPLPISKTVLCKICWKEMNTQLILDDHCKSPKHLKEENERLIVRKLKEEYRQLKELHQTK